MSKVIDRLRNIDPGYYLILALCILALWPIISRSALPQETDAELHVYRLAELSRLVRGGEFYPRWSPNFYYGYGYPIFNYYAPLSYYIGLGVDLLPALGPVAGIKAGFIIGILGAALGMFGYAKRNWGRSAALIASILFVFAPYILFIDPHARGDVAETLSFGFFALSLWSLDGLRRRPTRGRWLASLLSLSGLILSHNLLSLIFVGILLAWSIWQIVIRKMPGIITNNGSRTAAVQKYRLLIAVALSIGITAFFWLTVFLEQDAVNLNTLVGQGGHFDFRNHFLSLTELLSVSRVIDWGATEPAFVFNLGLVHWLLAGLGLVMFSLKKTECLKEVAFFVLALVFLIFLMLPVSSVLWANIPYMDFVQFPWRLLGPTAAALAVVAGSGFGAFEKMIADRLRPWLLAVVVTLVLLSSLPLLQVPSWPDDFGSTSSLRVLNIELEGRWLGTTSTADFVPATVDVIPRPVESMVNDYRSGRRVDRINRDTLPEGTAADLNYISPNHMTINVSGSKPFLLRLYVFAFPGWQVLIDGEQADFDIGRPEGFIVVPVAAGDHQIEVEFGTTTERNVATIVSLLSIAAAGFVMLKLGSGTEVKDQTQAENIDRPGTPVGPASLALLLIIVLQIVAGDGFGWFNRHSLDKVEVPGVTATDVLFGDEIKLIGYRLDGTAVEKGGKIALDIYWKALSTVDENYQVFLHLIDGDGRVAAQSDKLNPGEFPTERWPTDKYVLDRYELDISDIVSPGSYRLVVGLWTADTGKRLLVEYQADETVSDTFQLPEFITID